MGTTTPARSGVYRSDPVKRNGLNACYCDDDMQRPQSSSVKGLLGWLWETAHLVKEGDGRISGSVVGYVT